MKHFAVRAFCAGLFLSFAVMVQAQDTRVPVATSENTNVIDGAVQPSVTKTFDTGYDVAIIDIVKGKISYQVYTTTDKAPDQWSLVDSQSVDEPKDRFSTTDATITQIGSYRMRVMLTSACDECANIKFLPR